MHTSDAPFARTRGSRAPRSLEETLDRIVREAWAFVPGFDEVGVSVLDSKGAVLTEAATGHLAWQLNRLQYDLHQGPSIDSLRAADVVLASNIEDDERWPAYVPRAVELGLRSQLSVRLEVEGCGTIGALSLYSTSSEEIDPQAESMAAIFTPHAALAMGDAGACVPVLDALQTRGVIETAVGIVMERYRLDKDGAFIFLVRASTRTGREVCDLAAELVEQVSRRA